MTLLANELKNESSIRVRSNSNKKDNKRINGRFFGFGEDNSPTGDDYGEECSSLKSRGEQETEQDE